MASMIMNKKDTQTLLKNIRTAGYTVSKKASNGPMTYEVNVGGENIFRAMTGLRGYIITYKDGFITPKG